MNQQFQFKSTDIIKHIACGNSLKVLSFKENDYDTYILTQIRWCSKCKELIKIGVGQRKVVLPEI